MWHVCLQLLTWLLLAGQPEPDQEESSVPVGLVDTFPEKLIQQTSLWLATTSDTSLLIDFPNSGSRLTLANRQLFIMHNFNLFYVSVLSTESLPCNSELAHVCVAAQQYTQK